MKLTKPTLIALTAFTLAAPTSGADKAELDNRIRLLATKFESMQTKPDKAIPAETLRQAQGIVLLDRTRAGFLFAYQGGQGVAMVRNKKSDKWSAPAFLKADEASVGVQIGAQQAFVVILFMSQDAARLLTEPRYNFGGEARGTAGNQTAGTEAKVIPHEGDVLVYHDRQGLYGGAAIKGGAITQDSTANVVYYGQSLSPREILFENKVKPTEAAGELALKIENQSRLAKK